MQHTAGACCLSRPAAPSRGAAARGTVQVPPRPRHASRQPSHKHVPPAGGRQVTSTSGTSFRSSSSTFQTSRGGGDEMREGRSFLEDKTKVTGITDVLARMGATEAVDHEAKVTSDEQARSLLNRFLGAQVLMSGVESMMAQSSLSESNRVETDGAGQATVTQSARGHASSTATKDGEVTRHQSASFTTPTTTTTITTSSTSKGEKVVVSGVDINEVTDEAKLNQLLDTCGEYEERRKIRMRLKALMAEKKGDKGTVSPFGTSTELRSAQGSSTQKSFSSSYSTSSTSSSTRASHFASKTESKTVSPFEKFKKLDSQQSPRPANGRSGPAGGGPLFQLSSSLSRSASGVKDLLLNWCQCRTRDYKGVKIENFSTSWNDGMAFCALVHHFYPDAFDFDKLDPKNRRYNFELAFRVADERAGVMPLLDVEDMVMMKKPDWKCVFTYVQSLYKRFKDE